MNAFGPNFENAAALPPRKVERPSLNHIRMNHYVMFDGAEALIEDFFPHNSYYSPITESTVECQTPTGKIEDVKVKIDGEWHKFSPERFQALSVPANRDLPSNLQIGARIRTHGVDDTIKRIYLMKTPENETGRVVLDCNVLVNCTFDPRKVHIFNRDGMNGYSLGYART